MANIPEYVCTNCHRPTRREDLTVKKVMFTEMGAGATTIRSRVVGWLCELCRESDNDFHRDRFSPPRMAVALDAS